jgi:hypothetical protein
LKKYFSLLYFPLGWTIVMQILLCLPGDNLPHNDLFDDLHFDKFVHVVLFGAFVALWCYYLSGRIQVQHQLRKVFFAVFLFAAFNGILIEYIQFYFIPFRSFDNGDIIADLLGSSIAYGICNVKLLTC